MGVTEIFSQFILSLKVHRCVFVLSMYLTTSELAERYLSKNRKREQSADLSKNKLLCVTMRIKPLLFKNEQLRPFQALAETFSFS